VAARGVDCELLVYSDEGHGLAKRANRLDAFPRALEFLRRHLGNDRARVSAEVGAEPRAGRERTL